jgi:hypothetical protein
MLDGHHRNHASDSVNPSLRSAHGLRRWSMNQLIDLAAGARYEITQPMPDLTRRDR